MTETSVTSSGGEGGKTDKDQQHVAEKCILALGRNPLKLAFLREINVLCVEELGLISADLLAVIDRCLRVARRSNLPYGGIMLLCSMDPIQLPPIQGHPLLTSPMILVTFRLVQLTIYVRSATDHDLQRINEIGRIPSLHLHPELIDEYCEIITRRCRFATSFASVPHDVLRVVGKRIAEQEVIKERDDYIRTHFSPEEQYVSESIDLESSSNSIQWKIARKEVALVLDKKCLEPAQLRLVRGVVMRITQNDTTNRRYSQGQLCVVSVIPAVFHGPVHVFLAPAGYRQLPSDGDYVAAGWQEIKILFPTSGRDTFVRPGLLGQRLQYSLRPFCASTVHRCMGSTLPSVCAQLSTVDKKHELWLRSQLYTLFSRVKRLDDIILIGDVSQALTVIRFLLNKVQQFDEYIDLILRSLDMDSTQNAGSIVRRDTGPFRYHASDLPETSSIGGCVYILLSMMRPSVFHIGSTISIRRRLLEHNRCQGAISTQDPMLIPWLCVGLITGFDAPNAITWHMVALHVVSITHDQRSSHINTSVSASTGDDL